jgi:hypothetical protein
MYIKRRISKVYLFYASLNSKNTSLESYNNLIIQLIHSYIHCLFKIASPSFYKKNKQNGIIKMETSHDQVIVYMLI